MAGSTDPILCNCIGSVGKNGGAINGTSAVFRGVGLASNVVGRSSSFDNSVRGAVGGLGEFDGSSVPVFVDTSSASRFSEATSVVAGSTDLILSDCMSSVGTAGGVVDEMLAVFRGGGLASTDVGLSSSFDDSVRGAVGGLREYDGEAFLALEVLASGLST